jgi:integrase
MARPRSIPSYRLHRQSGQAVVTLTDGLGGRRDVLLGQYGTAASRAEYARVLAEWEATGRSLPCPPAPASHLTVNELILAYWKHAEVYYGFDGERGDEGCLRSALRILRETYGHTQAADFGPLALKACRQQMVGKGWSRNYTNAQVDRIRRMFRWAASEELLPNSVYLELKAVPGLRRGKTEAREMARVMPANPEHVEAALPYMPTAVQGMVRFQQLTGCRPAEACLLRAIDLDRSNPACWVYRPGSDQGSHGEHKTAHHGHDRVILIGPRAQELIRAYLKTDLHAYLFCPMDATQERNEKVRARRKTPVASGEHRGQRKLQPRRVPGGRYTVRVYARAIARACRKAGVPEWGPNRLRHSRATELRPYGLDVVKTILGHSKVETSQVYAEKDLAAAMELIAKIG